MQTITQLLDRLAGNEQVITQALPDGELCPIMMKLTTHAA